MKGRKKTTSNIICKKKNDDLYFSSKTHDAIIRFQSSDIDEREKIYQYEILPAFDKLVENLIYIHGFTKDDDCYEIVKSDCLGFLYETICKFDRTKGTKAFSYFNVVARNWLIIKSKQKMKNKAKYLSIDDTASLTTYQKQLIENHHVLQSQEDDMIDKEFKDDIMKILKFIEKRLTNQQDKVCLDAIFEIFNSVDDIELLNKRAVLFYIREMTSLNSKEMSIAMSNLRRFYQDVKIREMVNKNA